ncbi:hypothetical protein K439DRAFT_1352026, partial [Ramaria rubella]
PPQFGSKSHGKLKADEWQAMATVYFPITLIRLWGMTDSSEPIHKKLLENTMDLVSAVLIATAFEVSPSHTTAYTAYMQQYLRGLKELFPTFKFRDNHHVVLHLKELLNALGPVHSWWMFPFEHLISKLVKISTNWILGML